MSGLLRDEGVTRVEQWRWWMRRRVLHWLARRMFVPTCDGCAVPITGMPVHVNTADVSLCAGCAARIGMDALIRAHEPPR